MSTLIQTTLTALGCLLCGDHVWKTSSSDGIVKLEVGKIRKQHLGQNSDLHETTRTQNTKLSIQLTEGGIYMQQQSCSHFYSNYVLQG